MTDKTITIKCFVCFLIFKNSFKVDFKTVGGEIGYSIKAKEFIDNNLENVEIIIQNASFIQRIDSTKYTIMFLQDDLRQMNISSPIQEKNIIDLILENFESTFGWVKNIGG